NVRELEDAAKRILYENTGLKDVAWAQLYAFAGLKSPPQGRILTAAYYALLRSDKTKLKSMPLTSSMRLAKWFPLNKVPDLAFEHSTILKQSVEKLRRRIANTPIAFELLPDKFTLTQLQMVYESILGRELDKRNFRKKMINYG